jgi:hypothetical protein
LNSKFRDVGSSPATIGNSNFFNLNSNIIYDVVKQVEYWTSNPEMWVQVPPSSEGDLFNINEFMKETEY